VLRILTAINSGKSRQTNAIILCRIISEFNADFTNYAPLKLIWFEPLSANDRLPRTLSVNKSDIQKQNKKFLKKVLTFTGNVI